MSISESLAATDIFKDLSTEQMEGIVLLARGKGFHTGEYLFREGAVAADLYLVTAGQVLLTMQVMQPTRRVVREVSVTTVGPQEIIGFWALFAPRTYALSAKAILDVRCLAIDGDALTREMSKDAALGDLLNKRVIRLLMQRLDQTAEVLAYERAVRLY